MWWRYKWNGEKKKKKIGVFAIAVWSSSHSFGVCGVVMVDVDDDVYVYFCSNVYV